MQTPCTSSSVLSIFCQQHHQCLPLSVVPTTPPRVKSEKESYFKEGARERERDMKSFSAEKKLGDDLSQTCYSLYL